MEWVPWAHLSELGPWGLVTAFVLLVFSGYLVRGSEVRYWREAFFAEQEMRRDLEVTGRIVRTTFQALPPESPEEP
jgi:hypothetical protein